VKRTRVCLMARLWIPAQCCMRCGIAERARFQQAYRFSMQSVRSWANLQAHGGEIRTNVRLPVATTLYASNPLILPRDDGTVLFSC
jgi:hypothetical protein